MVSDSPQQLASWVDLQFASACTPCIISTGFYARRSKGAEIAAAEKAARDAQAKADAIDAAVYDLKALNPRIADADTRSREILPDGVPDRGQNLADQHEMFVRARNHERTRPPALPGVGRSQAQRGTLLARQG